MRRKCLSLIGAILLLFIITGCKPAKVRLVYAATQGMRLKYKVISDIESEISESGTIPMKVHSEIIMNQEVENVGNEEKITIRIVYGDGFIQVLDKKLSHPLDGESFTMEMSKEGKILKIDGLEDVQSEVLGGIDLRMIFQETQIQFLNKLVEPGDKWTFYRKIKTRETSAAVQKGSFVFKKYEEIKGYNCARIEGTFSTSFTTDFSELELGGKVKGEESGKITIYFAPREGKLVKSSLRMEVNSAVETDAAGKTGAEPAGQKLNVKMDTVLVE